MQIQPLAVAAGIGYLLGSLMFAVFLSRVFHGVNIHEVGSGNPGFTNVFRGVSRRTGTLVLLLDIGKGIAAVLIATTWVPKWFVDAPDTVGLVAGLGAIAGHGWPLFSRFRGGKGVATAAGVFGALAPVPLFAAFGVWTVVLLLSRIMSVASIASAIAFPAILTKWGNAPVPVVVVAWIVGLSIVLRHKSNIARLRRGEERRFSIRKG